jgi:hypothetical protein
VNAITDLTEAATAADPACVGCALVGDAPAQPGWLVVQRADGLRVRIDGVASDSPAVAAVLALDLSAEAVAARELNRTRSAALMGLLTSGDDVGIAVRATVAAITFLVNNRLEHFSAQIVALGGTAYPEPVRVLQNDILAYLQQNPTAGDPLPSPP